jgi:hypothetical protein
MDNDKTVTAHFTQEYYTLTIDVIGNGSVEINPIQSTYTYGTTVQLSALADPGWLFQCWSGNLSSTNNQDIIIMDNNKTISATFKEPTIVSVLPSIQTIGNGEPFEITIYIEPIEPIKGINFDYLYFNETIININSVLYENYFDPYNTYPSSPIIDNINGEIRFVYELIIGPGSVAADGIFVTIQCSALYQLGTSDLNLSDIIIANETGVELPTVIHNGAITVEESTDTTPPEITDIILITSDPLDETIGWEYFSCTVTDNTAVDEVKLVLMGNSTIEYPMTTLGGDIYYRNITMTLPNVYNYTVWADDTNDNENLSDLLIFELPMNEDVDRNGRVHFMDLVAVSLVYNDIGSAGWIREDVDNSGKVHFMDLVAISLVYNEEWK